MERFSKVGVTPRLMASRITQREDGKMYSSKFVYEILEMYMDECQKALIKGERVQIAGVGTIIPKVHATREFRMPNCNKVGGNPPYTTLKMTRTDALRESMNKKLVNNVKNGIYGLECLPLLDGQVTILRNSGYLQDDCTEENEQNRG